MTAFLVYNEEYIVEIRDDLIIEEMRDIKRQEISKYKKNVKFHYDSDVICKFKKKFPEKVEKIRQELLKDKPRLKYNLPLLEKRIDKEIFPSILLQQDCYIFFDKISKKTCGGTHLKIENKIKHDNDVDGKRRDDIIYNNCRTLSQINNSRNGGIKMLTIDIVESMLEELTLQENTMIKMAYGIEPYDDRKYTLKEIAEQADVSSVTASKYIKNIIRKLREKCIKEAFK
jgi:DNA-binding CsgD family transcriptional regulator